MATTTNEWAKEEIKAYAELINEANENEDVRVPAEILGKVMQASNVIHFNVWESEEPGYFLVSKP